uniref:(northern house mosquito) hypothetical protein n=1 Tax=Culex pipiens TaxID=7175 RepID=A0A8D8B6S3_CULPI
MLLVQLLGWIDVSDALMDCWAAFFSWCGCCWKEWATEGLVREEHNGYLPVIKSQPRGSTNPHGEALFLFTDAPGTRSIPPSLGQESTRLATLLKSEDRILRRRLVPRARPGVHSTDVRMREAPP